MNVFNGVTSRALSYRCVLFYFLTMPVGLTVTYLRINTSSQWHQNCHYLQTIHFQVEWLIATLIPLILVSIEKIYQILKTVFDYIFKHLEVRQKYSATRRIFNSLLCVWKCDETQSFVCNILHETLSLPFDIYFQCPGSEEDVECAWQSFIYYLKKGLGKFVPFKSARYRNS